MVVANEVYYVRRQDGKFIFLPGIAITANPLKIDR
jgi:hypothetical protein